MEEQQIMQPQFNFMRGQCFNFAYAMCQVLQDHQSISSNLLVSATGTRDENQDTEFVCIHCAVKAYHLDSDCFVYLDAQGIHPDDYLECIAEDWQNVEIELGKHSGQVIITSYIFSSEADLYWANLENNGAQINLSSIALSKQYILDNTHLYREILLN
jgi:hypothetical protein